MWYNIDRCEITGEERLYMIRVNEVKLSLEETVDIIPHKLAKLLRIRLEDIISYKIYKESIDARKAGQVYFVYTVDVETIDEEKLLQKNSQLVKTPDMQYHEVPKGTIQFKYRPVVIGFGPSGMFAGLILAQRGYRPIILERGQDVDNRTKDVEEFWKFGKLNPESNVQFGEGGAGTFSDGKLTTRIKDRRCRKILEELVSAGAPKEILYSHKPHIGTDVLKQVVKNIRCKIEQLGGEIYFSSKVTDFIINGENLTSIEINGQEKIPAEAVILGIGHSSRDTYEVLNNRKVQIRQKPFAIGVRIEHQQRAINKAQYKEFAEHPRLGAADYKLTYQTKEGRAVYTFCMCPGGTVVAAASEEGGVVTNGMSEYARNKENANSALLVQVKTEDFGSNHPLAGVEFQRKWEKAAYRAAGSNYNAPTQRVGDFMQDKVSADAGNVIPTYLPGVTWCNLKECLPDFVITSIKEAIPKFEQRMKGFAIEEAVMTGVETRSSAPVRIERAEDVMESVNVKGLFPVGEGAGYAGGIISAAADGMKAAEMIIMKFSHI